MYLSKFRKAANDEIGRKTNFDFVRDVIEILRASHTSLQKYFEDRINFMEELNHLQSKLNAAIKNLDDRLPRYMNKYNFPAVARVLSEVKVDETTYLKCLDLVCDYLDNEWKSYEIKHRRVSADLEDRDASSYNVDLVKVAFKTVFSPRF